MPSTDHLPIAGYRDEPVPNTFLRQDGPTGHLAVFLPGFGYSCDMPLFYYAENVLLDAGADLLRVEYAYNRRPGFGDLADDEQRRWLVADAAAALRAGLGQRAYREVTLVGKSLGTLAMAHLLAREPVPERVRAVWLTPLLREPAVAAAIRRHAGPSLLAIGTADPHYDPALLDDTVPETGVAVVVEGADHGFDVPGNAVASVRAVERVVAGLPTLLAR